MATLTPPVERQVLLHGVSWETYERLLSEHQDSPGTHFIYDEGELEIMVVSLRHEEPNRDLAMLVQLVSIELDIAFRQLGSTTFKRQRHQKGFEPDSAFYLPPKRAAEDSAGEVTPAPDLIIEVEITTPALERFPIFAAVGVREIWRYADSRLTFYRLDGQQYVEINSSIALPPLTPTIATRFLEERSHMDSTEWAHHIRDWARQQR
jgi:Uma2 family endonuclease